MMKQAQADRDRNRILRTLPDAAQILRGSLLERTIHHKKGCLKCDRGEGHLAWVLTVGYAGGRTRQISLRPEQVPRVREWLENYHHLRAGLEQICELNQQVLRDRTDTGEWRRKRD